MLIDIVEVSNVLSVLIIFLVFCAMVVFILRLQSGIAMTSDSSVNYNPNLMSGPLPVIKIFNPFVFKLLAEQCILKDVVCVVSSSVPWSLLPLWGVDVTQIHDALSTKQPSWNVMRDHLLNNDDDFGLLVDAFLYKGQLQTYEECTDLKLHLSPSIPINPRELGRSPRVKYPLVIVLFNRISKQSQDSQRVDAMIIVVHVRDDISNGPSCVLAQYLKMSDGQLSSLKQLYVPVKDDNDGVNLSDEGTEMDNVIASTIDDGIGGSLCLICRTLPASRALLPCRHVCSCNRCFARLGDRCPMCRSHIQTYFCIGDDNSLIDHEDGNDDGPINSTTLGSDMNWTRRFQRWNDWLNRTLGFT